MSEKFLDKYSKDPLMEAKLAVIQAGSFSGDKFADIEAQLAQQRLAPQALRDSIEEYLGRFRTTTENAIEVVWDTAEKRGVDLHRDAQTRAVNTEQVYESRPFLKGVIDQVRQSQYADFDMLTLPEDYKDANFDDFEILCEGHSIAQRLLQKFGIDPPKGLYFWGNYGTGKTHLVSAYALSISELMELGYLESVARFTDTTMTEASKKYGEFNRATEALRNRLQYNPNAQETYNRERRQLDADTDRYLDVYTQNQFEEIVGASLYKPSDLAFVIFDDLFDRKDDDEFVEALLSRRIVIIDDIHPKGERARMDLIQRIIERRYNEARTGATFITSNIAPEQLLNAEGYPLEVGQRVHSRLQEMCLPIEFTAEDYRVTKAKRQNAEILRMLEEE